MVWAFYPPVSMVLSTVPGRRSWGVWCLLRPGLWTPSPPPCRQHPCRRDACPLQGSPCPSSRAFSLQSLLSNTNLRTVLKKLRKTSEFLEILKNSRIFLLFLMICQLTSRSVIFWVVLSVKGICYHEWSNLQLKRLEKQSASKHRISIVLDSSNNDTSKRFNLFL